MMQSSSINWSTDMTDIPAFSRTGDFNPQVGVTLRDYFAIQAMQKLMGKDHRFALKILREAYEDDDAHHIAKGILADTAYQWADAMMKARDAAQ
jgi:hypothetical protein